MRRGDRDVRSGFTLIEMLLGTAVMVIVLVALMGAFVGQAFLTRSARNLTAAVNDATRVMEEIRRLNTAPNCVPGLPNAAPQAPYRTWNDWLNADGQGKSIMQSSDDTYEVIAVTCERESGGKQYCGPNQVGTEWQRATANTTYDPIRVTVAVGWRQQQRVGGGMAGGAEFVYTPERTTGSGKSKVTTPASFRPADTDHDGVVESQAMLTTLMTCR